MASVAVNTSRFTGVLKKHWRRILFYCLLLLVVLYLAPRQHDFYLEDDVRRFKREQITPFLIWFGVIVSVTFLIWAWVYLKTWVASLIGWGAFSVFLCWLLFVFNAQWLAAGLFVNRLFDRGVIEKKFVVSFVSGIGIERKSFRLFDPLPGGLMVEDRVTQMMFRADLKRNDTARLILRKGLFGVGYYPGGFTEE